MQSTATSVRPGFLREFFTGIGFLRRGFGMWLTSPRLMLLGVIPALIVGTVYIVAVTALFINIDAIAVWITPFANNWADSVQTVVHFAAALAVGVVGVLLAAYTFAAVTLAVGDPFYERIWRQVEVRLGNPPAELELGFWRSLRKAVGDGIRLLIPAIGVGLLVFACGFIPLVGSPIALTIGALLGGRLLSVELTGFAFDARGYSVPERRRALRTRRARTLGFGVASYLLFLVPVLAVVVMPSAVAGAAMLSRDVLAPVGSTGAQPGAQPSQVRAAPIR